LENRNHEFLFYAAFEIRCGVEARMQEYLEVQQHISKRKRQGWKVAQLARNIEDAFRLGEKDAVLRVLNKNTQKVEFEARYTPVKTSLRKKAEKLGNFLHSSKKIHDTSDDFWAKFRSELEKAVEELERATSGRLLGPLLIHPNQKRVDMKLELQTEEEHELTRKFTVGSEAILQIKYE